MSKLKDVGVNKSPSEFFIPKVFSLSNGKKEKCGTRSQSLSKLDIDHQLSIS